MLGFWLLLRSQHSAWFLVAALLTTKSSDIGAYAVGCTIGRHKLIPWLSPGKSWEGFIGGIATSALVAALFAHFGNASLAPNDQLPVTFAAIVGAFLGCTGQCGDLCESALKRDAGAKDSGNLLPGMGGVLDVLDSLLLAGPALWWILMFAPYWS
ncbi:MAG: CDP-archaeol synthase [Phycisphaerales bacterium]|nr:CDP-archaeol synthase [Phycisphaerales bacterium]